MPKLTKQFVSRLSNPAVGQIFVFDQSLKGFGVRITPGAKTYIAQARVKGKVCRTSIGKHEVLTTEEARLEAKRLLGLMARGIDPNQQKAEQRTKAITLGEVLDDYLQSRNLKVSTAYGYRKIVNRCFPDWLRKPVTSLSKDMVERRHKKLSDHKAQSNLAMRVLRALITYAASKYEDRRGNPLISENPVKRLSQLKAWHRVPRRQTTIALHDLPAWYKAVQRLHNHTIRDYLLLILFTGLRRTEAMQLRWYDIDLEERTLFIPAEHTKNHQPHLLPLSDFLVKLLQARPHDSQYVFASVGRSGYLNDPRRAMRQVSRSSRVTFTLHDLRRRFLTIAESLDIPHYALKRLANHKDSSDVTAGYIVADVERLREPMQRITNFILGQVGAAQLDKISL